MRKPCTQLCEKRHVDEALNRGSKAMDLAEQLFALHVKACDRNVNIKIPLGKSVIELFRSTFQRRRYRRNARPSCVAGFTRFLRYGQTRSTCRSASSVRRGSLSTARS